MEKKIFVTTILWNLYLIVLSQHFSTKLHIRSVNNSIDSIEIGYDADATKGVDTAFGEVDYFSPLQSNMFRAYIVNPSTEINNNTYYLRKQIMNIYSGWVENGAMGIVIPFDSLPATISWDKSLFENPERNYSLITDWTYGGWFDAGSSTFKTYMKDVSSVQLQKTASNYTYYDDNQEYKLYVFYLAFASKDNISTGFKDAPRDSDIQVYTNSSCDFILIKNKLNKLIKRLKFYTSEGKFIGIENETCTNIDCSSWPTGTYIVFVELSNETISYKIQIKR